MADATLPAVIFASLVMVVGVVGNSVVCYICGCRLRRSVLNNFVLSLAILDVIGCALCVPLEVAELQNSARAWEPGLCIGQRFFRSILIISSVFVLVAIATERYRRICHPLSRHINLRQCRLTAIGAVVIAVLLSWPSLFIFGERSVAVRSPGGSNGSAIASGGDGGSSGSPMALGVGGGSSGSSLAQRDGGAGSSGPSPASRVRGGSTVSWRVRGSGSTGSPVVTGWECGVKDEMQASTYPVVYFSLLFIIFFLSSAVLTALYARIAFRIWRPRKLQTDMSRTKSASLPDCRRLNAVAPPAMMPATSTLGRGGGNGVRLTAAPMPRKLMEELTRSLQIRRKREGGEVPAGPGKGGLKLIMFPTPSFRSRGGRKPGSASAAYSRKRTTFIMFLMTLTSVVSYLPYILVNIVYVAGAAPGERGGEEGRGVVKGVVEVCLKSFLISSAVNPFIYGLCNQRFKKECVQLLQGVSCRVGRRDSVVEETSDTPPHS